uniref:Uncharacterized protein n=1 Tax=Candidatus Kentrum sp. LFY TaxID=2126342 RepID=A0A450VAY5_9GAMM|nr:MAG: hypothetical protein BECKLFY1418A_GA0070994_11685 [Candidatus Kentron sp. LFY]
MLLLMIACFFLPITYGGRIDWTEFFPIWRHNPITALVWRYLSFFMAKFWFWMSMSFLGLVIWRYDKWFSFSLVDLFLVLACLGVFEAGYGVRKFIYGRLWQEGAGGYKWHRHLLLGVLWAVFFAILAALTALIQG